MTLESHPLRDVIVSEMHMRRMPPLAAPVTMTQTVRLLAPEERDTERAHIGAMPHVAGDALGIRDRDAASCADGDEPFWESPDRKTVGQGKSRVVRRIIRVPASTLTINTYSRSRYH